MKNNVQRRTLVAGTVLMLVVLALFTFVRYRAAQARQEEVRKIGADWQQSGLLPENDYVRLHALGHSAVQTHTISDQDLDWSLDKMKHSQSPIVHARVMGMLSALVNLPSSQKGRINTAITPLLQSRSDLDRRYALRVQRLLNLSH